MVVKFENPWEIGQVNARQSGGKLRHVNYRFGFHRINKSLPLKKSFAQEEFRQGVLHDLRSEEGRFQVGALNNKSKGFEMFS